MQGERTSDIIEQLIFLTVHRPWSNNDCLWKDRLNRFFALRFRPVERGRRVDICIEMGGVYEARYAILSANSGDPLRAGDMHVVELEVSSYRQTGNFKSGDKEMITLFQNSLR